MSLLDAVIGVGKDAAGAVVHAGQELLVDFPRFIVGKATGNDVAAENARQDTAKHGTQALKDLNNVLKNSAIDEVVSKIPYGDKLRGPVTQGLDKLTDLFDKEMQRQGIIPGDRLALSAPVMVMERAAPKLPNVPHAPGVAKKAHLNCA